MPIIAPSLLACNFLQLETECTMVNNSEADWFHLDVMDGRFVPNISFGLPVIQQIKKVATKPLDVHLMIIEPDLYVEAFKKAGADITRRELEAAEGDEIAGDADALGPIQENTSGRAGPDRDVALPKGQRGIGISAIGQDKNVTRRGAVDSRLERGNRGDIHSGTPGVPWCRDTGKQPPSHRQEGNAQAQAWDFAICVQGVVTR